MYKPRRLGCLVTRELLNPLTTGRMNRSLLLFFATASSIFLPAEPIRAHHKQGSMHGFLLVRSAQGKVIAVGDLVQIAQGTQVRSRLVLRFRDGSVDEESTVFSEDDVLRLLSDHHVQKGPSFPVPLDIAINVPAAEVRWSETKGSNTQVHTDHMDLPNDLANGILPLLLDKHPSKRGWAENTVVPGEHSQTAHRKTVSQSHGTGELYGWQPCVFRDPVRHSYPARRTRRRDCPNFEQAVARSLLLRNHGRGADLGQNGRRLLPRRPRGPSSKLLRSGMEGPVSEPLSSYCPLLALARS